MCECERESAFLCVYVLGFRLFKSASILIRFRLSALVGVCVCEREREKERESVCVREREFVCPQSIQDSLQIRHDSLIHEKLLFFV